MDGFKHGADFVADVVAQRDGNGELAFAQRHIHLIAELRLVELRYFGLGYRHIFDEMVKSNVVAISSKMWR